MGDALFGDFSEYQGTIDWSQYTPWSARGDGIPRVGLRAGQGVGGPDRDYLADLAGARASGIRRVYHYWYAYPNLHPSSAGAQAEAASFLATIAGHVLPTDRLMLDLEQNEQSGWAAPFGLALRAAYPGMAKPVLYDSLAHIQAYLQDPVLPTIFDLAIADWTFNPDVRPAAPAPWNSYLWLQFSDRLQIPGISGPADADIFLGGDMFVPDGWTDDGTTLTAPNGVKLDTGMRSFVMDRPYWPPENVPLAPEHEADPVDSANPALGNGTRVDFVYWSVGWSRSQNAIGFMQVGKELQQQQPPPADPEAETVKSALKTWLGV